MEVMLRPPTGYRSLHTAKQHPNYQLPIARTQQDATTVDSAGHLGEIRTPFFHAAPVLRVPRGKLAQARAFPPSAVRLALESGRGSR